MTDPQFAIQSWLDRDDQSAAHWLVDTYRPTVRNAVCRWLPHERMIEDVVQETFIKAFKALPRLLPGSRLEPWLCSIARNTCANHLRSWKRNIVTPATDCGIDDYDEMIVSYDAPPDDDAETELAVEQLLSRLQEQDRRMLQLFHIEGRTARDVGHSLGITEGNVRIRIMRSHRALREHACALRSTGLL